MVSRPGHCSGHCLDTFHGHCSRTLFTVKKNNIKFLKIFLCMIKYMRYSYCIYYKCINVVCEKKKKFRCVNSVSGLYLHPLRYVINVVCFFYCMICVSNCVEGHIHCMRYMGIMIAQLVRKNFYMHGLMRIGKR